LFDRVVDERSRIQRHLKRLRPAMLLFLGPVYWVGF